MLPIGPRYLKPGDVVMPDASIEEFSSRLPDYDYAEQVAQADELCVTEVSRNCRGYQYVRVRWDQHTLICSTPMANQGCLVEYWVPEELFRKVTWWQRFKRLFV